MKPKAKPKPPFLETEIDRRPVRGHIEPYKVVFLERFEEEDKLVHFYEDPGVHKGEGFQAKLGILHHGARVLIGNEVKVDVMTDTAARASHAHNVMGIWEPNAESDKGLQIGGLYPVYADNSLGKASRVESLANFALASLLVSGRPQRCWIGVDCSVRCTRTRSKRPSGT